MTDDTNKILFERIVKENKGIFFKVARTYCRNDDDRQDLMQEMMMQIWRSLYKYDDGYKISTWLYRICLNTAISFYRKNNMRVKNTAPLDEQNSNIRLNDNPADAEDILLLKQFIDELNDIDKALMLLYLEDRSHSEIADVLGISQSNVGTKIGRIKEKLKKQFSKLY